MPRRVQHQTPMRESWSVRDLGQIYVKVGRCLILPDQLRKSLHSVKCTPHGPTRDDGRNLIVTHQRYVNRIYLKEYFIKIVSLWTPYNWSTLFFYHISRSFCPLLCTTWDSRCTNSEPHFPGCWPKLGTRVGCCWKEWPPRCGRETWRHTGRKRLKGGDILRLSRKWNLGRKWWQILCHSLSFQALAMAIRAVKGCPTCRGIYADKNFTEDVIILIHLPPKEVEPLWGKGVQKRCEQVTPGIRSVVTFLFNWPGWGKSTTYLNASTVKKCLNRSHVVWHFW